MILDISSGITVRVESIHAVRAFAAPDFGIELTVGSQVIICDCENQDETVRLYRQIVKAMKGDG